MMFRLMITKLLAEVPLDMNLTEDENMKEVLVPGFRWIESMQVVAKT